jgi:integrase/recombinase XerD
MSKRARVLSTQEIKDLFKILKNSRDQALFACGLYSGLRISEIIAIKQKDAFTANGGIKNVLRVPRLKKKKKKVFSDIPIHPKLRERLLKYKQDVPDSVWLFPTENSASGHLGRTRAHNILTNAFERLNLDGATTHSMRRTCLTNMSRAGIPTRTIQEISGHANLSQLEAYLAKDPVATHDAISSLKY